MWVTTPFWYVVLTNWYPEMFLAFTDPLLAGRITWLSTSTYLVSFTTRGAGAGVGVGVGLGRTGFLKSVT